MTLSILLIVILGALLSFLVFGKNKPFINPASQIHSAEKETSAIKESANRPSENLSPPVLQTPVISFVGPRQNIPDGVPTDYGFWSFAVPVPGALSRSGQPTLAEFRWLRDNGWKSVVNLRISNDHGEQADDDKISGFSELGLNYMHLSIADGAAPTDEQAQEFLNFVTDGKNQPAHVHCRGGYGRTGTMIALYRYFVQGWPLDKAIEESRLFHGGISHAQKKWLEAWVQTHAAKSYTSQ